MERNEKVLSNNFRRTNPTLLKPFIDVMENTDFITTMGAGCHAHPKGTTAGALALVKA